MQDLIFFYFLKDFMHIYRMIYDKVIIGSENMRTEDELRAAIEQYSNMIRKICFLYMKQESDIDDIFQNVFLKYMKNNVKFENLEHEKAWFIRVTMNACKDFLGSWFHKKVDLTESFQQFRIKENTPDYDMIQSIMKLDEKYRDVIYLYYYEGYSMRDIAHILHKSENTIYTWHSRAKKLLKKELGGDYFE